MADSVQDILEEWVCEYHTTGITPNGVKIVFMEYTEGFDDDAQEGYIDENQPIYEVMIHKQSAEDDKEFSEDYDVEDVFDYEPKELADVVVSIGVLHHTIDPLNATKTRFRIIYINATNSREYKRIF